MYCPFHAPRPAPHRANRACAAGSKIDIAERVLNHARERIEATFDVHDYVDEKRETLDNLGTVEIGGGLPLNTKIQASSTNARPPLR